jgi:hypothetical protein
VTNKIYNLLYHPYDGMTKAIMPNVKFINIWKITLYATKFVWIWFIYWIVMSKGHDTIGQHTTCTGNYRLTNIMGQLWDETRSSNCLRNFIPQSNFDCEGVDLLPDYTCVLFLMKTISIISNHIIFWCLSKWASTLSHWTHINWCICCIT